MKQLIICDDNLEDITKAKTLISQHLQTLNKDYDIKDFHSGEDLLQACNGKEITPDIIFMDIELGEKNGIDTATTINQLFPLCDIVYLTHYLQYATDVYTTEHRYYILKSELERRIPAVFHKIFLADSTSKHEFIIPLKRKGQVIVHKQDIILVERYGRGTKFNVSNITYESNLTLSEAATSIGEEFVIPCHNSFYIGLNHIQVYERTQVELTYNINVPISRKYQHLVKDAFTKWTQTHLFQL